MSIANGTLGTGLDLPVAEGDVSINPSNIARQNRLRTFHIDRGIHLHRTSISYRDGFSDLEYNPKPFLSVIARLKMLHIRVANRNYCGREIVLDPKRCVAFDLADKIANVDSTY